MKYERWHKLGGVILTGEYVGGVLAGVGLGICVTYALLLSAHHVPDTWAFLFACGFTTTGSLLARAVQRKRFQKDSCDEKREA
jgi:hypothetical protein